MEKKFTQGEWIPIHNINKTGRSGIAVMDFQPHVICEMGDAEETEANQKLISAAPDLLEALQEVLAAYKPEPTDCYKTTPYWVTAANAAIKKATL